MYRSLKLLGFFLSGVLLAAAPLQAVDYSWIPATGYVDNPANWGGGVPGGTTTDNALIVNGGVATITSDHPFAGPFQNLKIGTTAGIGAAVQTGGTVTVNGAVTSDWPPASFGGLCLGQNTGSYGTYDMSGGELNVSGGPFGYIGFNVGAYGAGVFNQSGGTVNATGAGSGMVYVMVGWLNEAGYTPVTSVMNLTGGKMALALNASTVSLGLWVGPGGNGILNVGGTADLDLTSGEDTNSGLLMGVAAAPALSVVNIGGVSASKGGAGAGGGIVRTGTIYGVGYGIEEQSYLNFHGGTISATCSTAQREDSYPGGLIGGGDSQFGHLTHAYVYSEGAVFDTNGKNPFIAQPLEDPSAADGQGVTGIALTNAGSGFISEPVVTIEGDGVGATARAILNGSGGIDHIEITNPGTGYNSIWGVNFSGGGGTAPTLGSISLAANTSGGLRKIGLGTLTLSAANTYSGLTTVEAGTLNITGSIAGNADVFGAASLQGTGTVSGDVNIQIGGTASGSLMVTGNATISGLLTGSGTISSNVAVNTGGTINPGTTSTGTITFGGMTFQNNSNLNFDITSNTSYDKILVTGGNVLPESTPVTVNVNYTGTATETVTLLEVQNGYSLSSDINFALSGVPTQPLDSPDGANTGFLLVATPGVNGTLKLDLNNPLTDPQWTVASGNWSNSGSWTAGTPAPPPGSGHRARFDKPDLSGSVTVNLTDDRTLSSLIFNGPASYTIQPAGGTLTMDSSISTDWHVTVLGGAHTVAANIKMAKGTGASIIRLKDDTHLTLSGVVSDLTTDPSDLRFNGAFNSSSGTGVLTLSGANTYTGKTIIQGGVLQVASMGSSSAPNPLGQSDSTAPENLLLQGSTLEYIGSAGGNLIRAFTVQGNSTLKLNNNANLSAPIAGTSADTLNKTGTGTMALVYPAGLTTQANLNVGGGAASIAGGNAVSVSNLTVGSVAGTGFTQTGGTVTLNGTITGADPWPPTVIGGLCLGQDAGSSGSYQMSGGVLNTNGGPFATISFTVGGLGSGAYGQSGGTVNVIGNGSGGAYAMVGWLGAGTDSVMSVTGGKFAMQLSQAPSSAYGLWVGPGGNGVLNIGGSADVDLTATGSNFSVATGLRIATVTAPATGIVNIGGVDASKGGAGAGGGILRTAMIYNDNNVSVSGIGSGLIEQSYLNFHGGTVQATTSMPYWGSWIGNDTSDHSGHLTHAYVYSESAVFDTNGFSPYIAQPLEDPSVAGGQGITGITLSGTGSGFVGEPVVTVLGDGVGATARAIMNESGGIASIVITNPGTGYFGTPTISITGGGGTAPGVAGVSLGANVSGGVTKIGKGTLTLTSANTYTGTTTVQEGQLVVGSVNVGVILGPGSLAGGVDVYGGASLGGGGTISGNVSVRTGGAIAPGPVVAPGIPINMYIGGSLSIEADTTLTFDYDGALNSAITVSSMPTVAGSSVVDLVPSAPMTSSATLTVVSWGGFDTLTPDSLIPAKDTIGRNTLRLDLATAGQVNVVCNTIASEWSGPASGPDWNYFSGGNWTGYVPGNTANDLQMQAVFGASGTAGTVSVDSDLNLSSLIFDRSDSIYTLSGSGNISLSSSVSTKTKAQITVLSNPENVGHTVANNLVLNNPTDVNLSSGAILFLSGAISGSNGLTVTGVSGSNLVFAGTAANTYAGTTEITSTLVGLNKSGAGNYAIPGDVVVHSGALILWGNDQIAPTASLALDPTNTAWATMVLRGHTQTLAKLSGGTSSLIANTDSGVAGYGSTAGGTLTVNNAEDCTYAGYMRDTTDPTQDANTLALVKDGSGKLTLAPTGGAFVNYTGGTTVKDGVLDIVDCPNFQKRTYTNTEDPPVEVTNYGAISVEGGELRMGDINSQTASGVQLTGGSITGSVTLTSTSAFDVQGGTASVALAGNVGLTKTGAGSATLTGANAYTGRTTIAASGGSTSTVVLGSAGASAAVIYQNTPTTGLGGADIQAGKMIFADTGSVKADVVAALTASAANGWGSDTSTFKISGWVAGDPILGYDDDYVAPVGPGPVVSEGGNPILVMRTYPGDFDLSGEVDGLDLQIWKLNIANPLATWKNGNANYDDSVDGSDLGLWKLYFGKAITSLVVDGPAVGGLNVVGNAVPEPGTLVLLASALFGLLAYAWRKRK